MNQKINNNLKKYRGKDRIYVPVSGYPNISRIYSWDHKKKEYRSPKKGKPYLARRYTAAISGRTKRLSGYFESIRDARDWQAGEEIQDAPVLGILFSEVLSDWKLKKFPLLAHSTQLQYEKTIRLYFGPLMDCSMNGFNSKVIDQWIGLLKKSVLEMNKRGLRKNFREELKLLSAVLRYYREYHDSEYVVPVLRRHRSDAVVSNERKPQSKDLSVDEFLRFRDELRKRSDGLMLSALATIQFFQALRISEAAALYFEDFKLNLEIPELSQVQITRSVFWPRKKGMESYIQDGFKNSKVNEGMKCQPLFPESFHALMELFEDGKTGLVFSRRGKHLEYRTIQYHYNQAFKKAGLSYRSTHIMRHGGTRHVYNETKDLEVAKQLLGNKDLRTTLIYAQRDVGALTSVAQSHWKKSVVSSPKDGVMKGNVVQGPWDLSKNQKPGRNWSQTGFELKKV